MHMRTHQESELRVNESAVFHQKQPAIYLHDLVPQSTTHRFCSVSTVDGFQQIRVFLQEEIHVFTIKAILPEIVMCYAHGWRQTLFDSLDEETIHSFHHIHNIAILDVFQNRCE